MIQQWSGPPLSGLKRLQQIINCGARLVSSCKRPKEITQTDTQTTQTSARRPRTSQRFRKPPFPPSEAFHSSLFRRDRPESSLQPLGVDDLEIHGDTFDGPAEKYRQK